MVPGVSPVRKKRAASSPRSPISGSTALSVAHRAHASTEGLGHVLPAYAVNLRAESPRQPRGPCAPLAPKKARPGLSGNDERDECCCSSLSKLLRCVLQGVL
jgi:hypothetical protein